MVALGFVFMLPCSSWPSGIRRKNSFDDKRWLLRWALWFIPMPWVACELGWIVAEYGRQPWTIYGVLPTHLSTSTPVGRTACMCSLAGFFVFYTVLLVVEMYLMFKYARLGPVRLGTGRVPLRTAPAAGRLPYQGDLKCSITKPSN